MINHCHHYHHRHHNHTHTHNHRKRHNRHHVQFLKQSLVYNIRNNRVAPPLHNVLVSAMADNCNGLRLGLRV